MSLCLRLIPVLAASSAPLFAQGSNGLFGGALSVKNGAVSVPMQIVILLTLLALLPAVIMSITPFLRIAVVLHFLRQALGTQSTPSNQVLIGLSLFLTFFVMAPVGEEIRKVAWEPYAAQKIGQTEAMGLAIEPLRNFMLRQARESDVALMVQLAKMPAPKTVADLPVHVVIPAFALSEIRTAFQIGFVLFLPFLIIDLVVASVLMSMGMMMLPPVFIALPFKLLLFVLADGWHLVVRALVTGFR